MAILQVKTRPQQFAGIVFNAGQLSLHARQLGLALALAGIASASSAQMIGGPLKSSKPVKGAESQPGGKAGTDVIFDSSIDLSSTAQTGLASSKRNSKQVKKTSINYQVIGYYPSWSSNSFPASSIKPQQLTVINYAFLNLCWNGKQGNPAPEGGGQIACKVGTPNGALVLGDAQRDPNNLRNLLALKRQNPALKIIPSVGGWTWSNQFSNMAASKTSRSNFVRSTVALLRQYQLDGIDIDWEYPGQAGIPCHSGATCQRSADKKNFILLAQELRQALQQAGSVDGKHYLLTIAAGASSEYVKDGANTSNWLKRLAASLDWINLMSYDFHGPWDTSSGHLAPLYADPAAPNPVLNVDAGVALYLAAGIRPEQLVLGMPTYGYGWRACPAGATGTGQYQACKAAATGSSGATFDFAYLSAQGILRKDAQGKFTQGGQGYARYWNAASRVPYLYNASTQTFISYEDEASIHEKNLYLKAKGLKGAMFWELNADKQQTLGTVIAEDLLH